MKKTVTYAVFFVEDCILKNNGDLLFIDTPDYISMICWLNRKRQETKY